MQDNSTKTQLPIGSDKNAHAFDLNVSQADHCLEEQISWWDIVVTVIQPYICKNVSLQAIVLQ